MRALVLAALFFASACVSQQEKEERERAELSRRIDEICGLPEAEREAALEKVRKEAGLVLVCGADRKPPTASARSIADDANFSDFAR